MHVTALARVRASAARAAMHVVVLACAARATLAAGGGAVMGRPQVVDTLFATEDVVVAADVVRAPADGRRDATDAIQAAIENTAAAGGGVVFLPAGRYLLAGRLVVREGVTLRGDWAPPVRGRVERGTVLMPTADRGNADGPPAITLERGSGIREVAVWYPEQDPRAIVPYPWTLRGSETVSGNNYTVQNVTLVNSYQGFRVGSEWNELHTLRNVYGTPLKTGIWIDTTTDIGRLIEVDFGPRVWEESGLPGAPESPEARAAVRRFLRREGLAVDMGRSDWEYLYRVCAQGYGVGLRFRPGAQGTTNAVMFGCRVTDCGTALLLDRLNGIGLAATGCVFTGERPVHAPGSFDTVAQLNTCELASSGENALLLEGGGFLSMQNCSIAGGERASVEARQGSISLLGCGFGGSRQHVALGEGVVRARILGNRFAGRPRIANSSRGDVRISHRRTGFSRPDVSPHRRAPHPRPSRRDLLVVTDFGASPSAADNTPAFARALAAAGALGGGTVYVPPGAYRFAGDLLVPTGVELRGCFDVPHHTCSGGSVLMPTAGRGREDGTPFLSLEPRSGVRGLTIWYPEQDLLNVTPYPWTIRSLGPGCWLLDVTLGNAYQGADFWTHPSDGHVIRYLAGGLLKRGLFVSKCRGEGWVEDVMFNPHYTARLHPGLPRPAYERDPMGDVIEYQRANLEGIVFGRCERERVRGTFLYAAFDGIAFRDDGGGANARVIEHGTDTGSRCAVLEATGPRGVQFINAQLVPLGKHERGAIIAEPRFAGKASFFNTQIWAGNTSGIVQGNGSVLIQQVNTLSGGFILNGGSCALENVHFTRSLHPHVRVGEGCRQARLIANTTDREPLRVENLAGTRCVDEDASEGR